jgi:hypothetical protein
VDDDILDAFSPWERPPIASVYAVYGTNMDTKYNYRYHDTDVAGHWYQFSLENEVGNEQVCSKTGDGTVPYHSLSWAHTWLGPGGTPVNVTVAPQSVYFSAQQTKSFQAIRQGAHHHADYVHAKKKHGVCKVNPQDAASSKDGGASSTAGSSFFGGIFGGKPTVDEVSFYESTRSDGGRTWTVHALIESLGNQSKPLTDRSLLMQPVDECVGSRRRAPPRDPLQRGVSTRAAHRASPRIPGLVGR